MAALFVAGGDAAELLEPVDEPLDALAGAVRRAVEVRVAPLVLPGGDDGADAALAERPADVGVAVALVPGDALGAQPRPAASGPLDRALVKDRLGVAALMALPRTDDECHRLAATLGADVQLRGQATARPAEGLPRLGVLESGPFLGAPAACWCARTTVPSR